MTTCLTWFGTSFVFQVWPPRITCDTRDEKLLFADRLTAIANEIYNEVKNEDK